ncbi:MAG: hypothetical protein F6J90_03075 [Moorea sp. SIOASIH]|uniref:hypothetical protein n=1 Tax=Moorena sp. SIOASIH TaxID=2607817 RepID=UPI0013B8FC97|nr:hypothetical protein [Moorena sp. SIOASIH]NEO35341.1 hypothetical protein [Moorena sp. SIOASIH]NEO90935.1 hypothetical protein [Moorena sp. SIO3G5]
MVNLPPLSPLRVYSPSRVTELRNSVKFSRVSDQFLIPNSQLPIPLNHCMNQQRPPSCRSSWLYDVIEIVIVEQGGWHQGKATTTLTHLLG